MTNYAARGNSFDVELSQVLEEDGAVVGSRRHIGGAGDLLVCWFLTAPWLVECKTTAGGPWERFGPSERADLVETAERIQAVPRLAWKPPRKPLRWFDVEEFPEAKVTA